MPVISDEIRRPGDEASSEIPIHDGAFEDEARGDDEPSLSEILDSEESIEQMRLQDLKSHPNFLSIFSLIARQEIDLVDLPSTQGIEGRSYGLGSGVSSSVTTHETDRTTQSICAAGTIVALKRYHVDSSSSEATASSTEKLHRLLWQELLVFCHPFLRRHENISQLLFIGWERSSLYPVLALRNAAYGTLAQALIHLRSYDAESRKLHLTVDIITGLAVLHECGLIHGDIKTTNIIILDHPDRSIVARISDFNGVGTVSTFGQKSHHGFGTPIWQPPEVILKDERVDWKKVDTYALGMVIATLWSSEGFIPEGGTFLDPEMPYILTLDDQHRLATQWKVELDDSAQSLMSIAKRVIRGRVTSPTTEDRAISLTTEGILMSILTHTLSKNPKNRIEPLKLLNNDLKSFLADSGRHLSLPGQDDVIDCTYDDDEIYHKNVIIHPKYVSRNPVFQAFILDTSLKMATMILKGIKLPVVDDLPQPLEGDEDVLIEMLAGRRQSILRQLQQANVPANFGLLASFIGLSYLHGVGTMVDEFMGITWLHRAAQAMDRYTVAWLIPLEQSLGKVPNIDAPRRFWAANAAFFGDIGNAAYLKDVDHDLYTLVTSARRRRFWGRISLQIRNIDEYFQPCESSIRADFTRVDSALPCRPGRPDLKESALHFCAATGNIGFAKFLVEEAGADVNLANLRHETPIFYATRAGHYEVAKFLLDHGASVTHVSTKGVGIMHCLSLMSDDEASALVAPFHAKGASILLEACESACGSSVSDALYLGDGLPIMWAASKNQHKLFDALLAAHQKNKIPHSIFKQLLEMLSRLHQHRMLEQMICSAPQVTYFPQLAFQAPEGRNGTIRTRFAPKLYNFLLRGLASLGRPIFKSPRSLSRLLFQALVPDTLLITRRLLQRNQWQSSKHSTITWLLKHGADPLRECRTFSLDLRNSPSLLTLAVGTSDARTLELLINAVEPRNVDVAKVFMDHRPFQGINALGYNITRGEYQIFLLLLKKYPELKDDVCFDSRTMLHLAAMNPYTAFTRELLDRGADRYARTSSGATPFTEAIMRNPNLEVAEMLAAGADMELTLGPSSKIHDSALICVLSEMLVTNLNIPFDRLRYLVENYPLPDLQDPSTSLPILARILYAWRPPLTDTRRMDLQASVLKYLVPRLIDQINVSDVMGMTALHYAAVYANVPAIRILIEHNAAVNILTQTSNVNCALIPGLTPLDLVFMRRRQGPDNQLKGGIMDIKRWQNNIKQSVELLMGRGGQSGPGARFNTRMERFREELIQMFGYSGVEISDDTDVPDLEDHTSEGVWPKRLPWTTEPKDGEGRGTLPAFDHSGANLFIFNDDRLLFSGPADHDPTNFMLPSMRRKFEQSGTTEVIGTNGLYTRMPTGKFNYEQSLFKNYEEGLRAQNFARRPPPAPADYLERLRETWTKVHRDRGLVLREKDHEGFDLDTL